MQAAVAQALSLERDNIVIKQREKMRGKAQYEKIAALGLTRVISEGDLRFKVNLSDYLDTGLFLDRRAMRRMIRDDSKNKRVLNLFCYTGSFSVHAAAGGAACADSVDLSNTYLNWARENFALNDFASDILRPEEYFAICNTAICLIRADAGVFLRTAAETRRRWDSIIIDPPAFSNSTMARADFDLKRDYKDLLAGCLCLLDPGGKIWFSANTRSFRVSAAELEIVLKRDFPGIIVTDISDKIIDEDFKKLKIPKAFKIIRN
jgi:23S rRNA G2069 N7-methylase RlmK/C1962 C5-methylase RlmI